MEVLVLLRVSSRLGRKMHTFFSDALEMYCFRTFSKYTSDFHVLNSVRIFQCGRVENSVVVRQCFESRTRMYSHFLLSGYSGPLSSSFLLSVFHPKTVTCGHEVHGMRILCCC
jgi:hypothetical protein